MRVTALLIAIILSLSCGTAPAAETRAAAPAWQIYKNAAYGFSFSYPANWQVFEHVNTPFLAQGLPAVFSLCLTPGPVKTLSCPAALYVVPEAQFVPPTKNSFLGLPSMKMDTYSMEPVWGEFRGEPFAVAHSAASASAALDGSTNHYVTRNGYVYLWSDEGGFGLQEPWKTMLSSLKFSPPAPQTPACKIPGDCETYCKTAGAGKECRPEGPPSCNKGQCACALTCR